MYVDWQSPLLFWEIVNIAIEILKQRFIKYITVGEIFRNVVQSVLFYPYGALWYLQALMIAVVIVYWCYHNKKLNQLIVASTILYLVGLLANTYFFLIDGTVWGNVAIKYIDIFVSSRNAIFVGLFFVSVGTGLGINYEKIRNQKQIHTHLLH